MPKKKAVKKSARRAPKAPQALGIVRSQREVADFFGVTLEAVAGWVRKGMPGSHRKYDLKAIATWRQVKKPDVSKDDPDLEWKRHRAALMQLRLQERRGELVPIEEHEQVVLRVCAIFRSGLLALIPTLSGQLVGLGAREVKAAVEGRVHDLLQNVSENVRNAGSSPKKGKRRGKARKA